MNEPQLGSLYIEDGKLYASEPNGDKMQVDTGLPNVTNALRHKGYIVATDGSHVTRTDGRVIEDITEGFRWSLS